MIKKWQHIGGWFNESDAKEYQRLISLCPNKSTIVEIGSFCGRSLICAAEIAIAKKIHIVSVDDWSQFNEVNAKEVFTENTKWLVKNGSLTILEMSSQLAAKSLQTARNVSLVFLDGAHDYQSVIDDIYAWFPIAATIAGHDYETFPDVKRAVSEVLPQHTANGNIWNFTIVQTRSD